MSNKIYHPAIPRTTLESHHQSRILYPRRGAVDLTATPPLSARRATAVTGPLVQVRTLPSRRGDRSKLDDRAAHFVVGRNEQNFPRISFFPHDGLAAGVAMGLAFYREGMVMKQSSIEHCLPPYLRDIESLPFTLQWPGYTHIVVTKDITLINPATGEHVSYGGIAQQISQIFSAFIQHFGDDVDDSRGRIQLGPKAVTFHNLRLLQIYVRDGSSLDVEVSYTRRN